MKVYLYLKKYPSFKKWKLLITTTKSLECTPLVITNNSVKQLKDNRLSSSNLTYIIDVNHRDDYLGIPRYIFKKCINFILFINEKTTPSICERIIIHKYMNNKKIINLCNGSFKFYIEVKDDKTQQKQTNQQKQTKNIKVGSKNFVKNLKYENNKYVEGMNNTIISTFANCSQYGNEWNVIYHDRNIFGDIPIVCCTLVDAKYEYSNEEFWINLMNICKKVYSANNVEWDLNVSWVNMLSMKNNLVDKYVFESKHDVYMETWFTGVGDCDEANMIYVMYIFFITCKDITNNKELIKMRNIAKDEYIPFLTFNYVSVPSASGVWGNQRNDKTGHWIVLFVPNDYFYSCLISISDDSRIQKFIREIKDQYMIKQPQKFKKRRVLLGESTAMLYPKYPSKKTDSIKVLFDWERKMSKITGVFFKSFISFYTSFYLEKYGIFGFCIGKRKKKGNKVYLNYRVRFDEFLKKDKDVVIVPFNPMDKNMVGFVKYRAESRMYTPKLLIDKKTGKHFKTYMSDHYYNDDEISKIKGRLKRKFKLFKEYPIGNKAAYKTVVSPKDLMDKEKMKDIISLSSKFPGLLIDVNEIMFKNYVLILHFFKIKKRK